ncbi:Lztr1, partial [Symbiodinium sp. CCMP2456]
AKTWHELVVASTKPPKRSYPTAVYDPQGKAMVVFGGWDGHDRFDDTWAFDLAAKTWHEVDVGSTKPPARNYPTAVYDPQGKAMVIFGGYDGHDRLDDTWAFDLAAKTWHELVVASTKPPKRSYHTAVYDPQGKAMVIFGGYDGHDRLDDTWALRPGGSAQAGRVSLNAKRGLGVPCELCFTVDKSV